MGAKWPAPSQGSGVGRKADFITAPRGPQEARPPRAALSCPGIPVVSTQKWRVGAAGAMVAGTGWVRRGWAQRRGSCWELPGQPVLTLQAWPVGFGPLNL